MVTAPRGREDGFTYLALVIFITIVGMVGALTLKAEALLRRAAAEEELLAIGADFADALKSYAAVTPKGQPTQPRKLEDLLRDTRFPEPRRHLRKIFVDPVTGKAEWGVQYQGEQGGVIAVYSLSASRPLKVGNFDPRFSGFDNRQRISDWKFAATGTAIVSLTGPDGPATEREDAAQQPAPFPSQEEPKEAAQDDAGRDNPHRPVELDPPAQDATDR
jgi:type II secretory pathway pseudopilin PulG